MKRTVVIAMGIAAVAGAGIAVAGALRTSAVQPVSATLAVNGPVQASLQECSEQAGTFTSGTLGASATATSSNTALKGPARLQLKGTIEEVTNAGTFKGTLRIDTASGPDTVASFFGVYANGELHGLLTGGPAGTAGVRDTREHNRLVANLSANLNPATGQLSSIKIGATDSGGPAVIIAPGAGCKPASAGTGTPSRPKP